MRHILQVARTCARTAERMGFTEDMQDAAFVMGMLHDIGYEKLPPGADISTHPERGAEMVGNALSCMDNIIKAIREHGHSRCTDTLSLILNLSDLSCGHDGTPMDPRDRVEGICRVHGEDSPHGASARKQLEYINSAMFRMGQDAYSTEENRKENSHGE